MSVGVMEDYKLRDLPASHTLGWSGTHFKKYGSHFKKKEFFFMTERPGTSARACKS